MPKRFGKPKGPTKEEIEAQAAREVERLTRSSMGPMGGPPGMGGGGMGVGSPGGLPTPLDNVARSLKGRSVKEGPRRPAKEPSLLPQGPVGSSLVGGNKKPGGTNPFGEVPQGGVGDSLDTGGGSCGAPGYDFINEEEAEDEEINITEMALRDHASRFGSRPEDLVIQVDVLTAEQMRDQAMAQFMSRQERRRPQAKSSGPEPTGESVLARLEARRKHKEQEEEAPPEGGVLGRLKTTRRTDDVVDDEDSTPRRGPPPRPKMRMIDEDEELEEDEFDDVEPEPAFARLASLSSIQERGGRAAKRAPAKKAPAKKAPAKRAPAKKAPAKKAPAKKAPAKKAPAKKAPMKRAPAKKAPAKKAPAKKAPAKRSVRSRRG